MIGLLSIVTLDFFLGMRHATEADHVIAVSTIVSRYRSVNHAVRSKTAVSLILSGSGWLNNVNCSCKFR